MELYLVFIAGGYSESVQEESCGDVIKQERGSGQIHL